MQDMLRDALKKRDFSEEATCIANALLILFVHISLTIKAVS